MDISQALNVINDWKPTNVETLSDLIPIDLIDEAYSLTDTVTMRKRNTIPASKNGLPNGIKQPPYH